MLVLCARASVLVLVPVPVRIVVLAMAAVCCLLLTMSCPYITQLNMYSILPLKGRLYMYCLVCVSPMTCTSRDGHQGFTHYTCLHKCAVTGRGRLGDNHQNQSTLNNL